MRRSEATTNTAATVCLAVAAAARVEAIPRHAYLDAFPIHLVTNVTEGCRIFA